MTQNNSGSIEQHSLPLVAHPFPPVPPTPLSKRERQREYERQWRAKNNHRHKEIRRRCLLKQRYGIALEDYNRMLREQNECCAICGKHKDTFKKALSVDHNHKTQQVRALLCHHCNRGIGHLMDDSNLLRQAADYLDKWNVVNN